MREDKRPGSGLQCVPVTHDCPGDPTRIGRFVDYDDIIDPVRDELARREEAGEPGTDDDNSQPRTAWTNAATFSGGVRRSMPWPRFMMWPGLSPTASSNRLTSE